MPCNKCAACPMVNGKYNPAIPAMVINPQSVHGQKNAQIFLAKIEVHESD